VSGGGDTNSGNNSASDTVTVVQLPDLTITKSHSGNFTAGQTGATYTIAVSDRPNTGPTNSAVTVTDTLPAGLTATAATGTGWACTVGATVSCTRSDVLGAGASYPPIALTVNVAANAPTSITNTSTVSGGGDATPGNNNASDTATVVPLPDLGITKSHAGNFVAGESGVYTIVVSNAAGAGPTTGMVTVTDMLPAGLTASTATGLGWTCTTAPTVTCTRSDVLAAGASYPPITLSVSVAAGDPALVINRVAVSGGGDATPGNNSASDPTATVSSADLSITKTHSSNFTAGQTGATFTIIVSNRANTGPTMGVVTVSDAMPTGLTAAAAAGSGWTCAIGSTVSCTRSDVLPAGASYPPITLTVNVAANAPNSITNTVTVSGGGDGNPDNNWASDTVTVISLPDLSISKSHSGDFMAGQRGTFRIVVSNSAASGPTSGTVTVTDPMPTGLTATAAGGTGWTCTVGSTVSCTRSDVLASGASYPAITLTVNVATNAPAALTNTVTVSGGGDITPANNTAVDTVSIVSVQTDLSIRKTHAGSFIPGQTGFFVLLVSNAATTVPTSGTVTVADTLPNGLTAKAAAGAGWSCSLGSTVTCTRSDVLAPGASYPPITLTVSVAGNAPTSVTNSATVSGGGDITPGNNTASDTVSIPAAAAPDLSISKSHSGTLKPGQRNVYVIVVSNAAGTGSTAGDVTVTDTLPTGLTATGATGQGWSCSVGPTVTCTRSDVLAPGASYPPILLAVNVSSDAPTVITNTATVAGGGDTTPDNNSDSDTSPVSVGPDLTIAKSHTGSLTPGQPATYTIVVSSAASGGATSGTVRVQDTLPVGLSATAATGNGWVCTVSNTVSCTRADVLQPGGSYPPITLTVNVAPDAPSVLSNTVTVSGGGDQTPGNNTATDTSPIDLLPDLTVSKTHSGSVTSGQTAVYTVVVSNLAPGPTTGTVVVIDRLPDALTAVSAFGTGWTCQIDAVPLCMRSDVLAPGASYPPITLTVSVAANAPTTITNTVTVSGGGDRSPANNSASDTALNPGMPADLSVTKAPAGTFVAGQTGVYTIVVSNAANAGPTVGPVSLRTRCQTDSRRLPPRATGGVAR
jgi:uncharacterized repeat protein (TIGR01451 family)